MMCKRDLGIATAVWLASVVLFASTVHAEDKYELCNVDPELFSRIAFPEGVPLMSERLIKWRNPPGIIVLSPDKAFEEASENLFSRLRLDGVYPATSVARFVTYTSPDEFYEVIAQDGLNNIFLIIDNAGFGNDDESFALQQGITDILVLPRVAERLLSDAQRTNRYALQSHISGKTGEVFSSVGLINPSLDDAALAHALYELSYAALSPPATYRLQEFVATMFVVATEQNGLTRISEDAKAYFRFVLRPDVPVGARPNQFVDCR